MLTIAGETQHPSARATSCGCCAGCSGSWSANYPSCSHPNAARPFTMAGFARMVERAGVEAKLGSKAIPYAAARRRLRPGRRRSSSLDQKKLHDLHTGSSSRSSFFAGRSVMSLINAWRKMESRLTADRWLARRSQRWPELAALRRVTRATCGIALETRIR
jgi:hypothetical protein